MKSASKATNYIIFLLLDAIVSVMPSTEIFLGPNAENIRPETTYSTRIIPFHVANTSLRTSALYFNEMRAVVLLACKRHVNRSLFCLEHRLINNHGYLYCNTSKYAQPKPIYIYVHVKYDSVYLLVIVK